MDLEAQRFGATELLKSLPKCSYFSYTLENFAMNVDDDRRNAKSEILDLVEAETCLIKSIYLDSKAELVSHAKRLVETSSEPLDRSTVSKLLHLCCNFDSADCASALLGGELGTVPLVNCLDESGKSALHTAAGAHAAKCVEVLLKKHARTDLRSRDGQAQLALEVSLSSTRMDVIWNPDDYSIEDLVVLISEKDLTTVKLLSEKTKEIAEVAYSNAVRGRIFALAALLIVAAEKVNESVLELRDNDSGSKQKVTIYECVIREALSLAHATTPSAKCASTATEENENSEKRNLLLREIELLQLFGAVAQTDRTDKKVVSPLIRAAQVGDEAVIQLLLKTNIDVNDADAEGYSALHWNLKLSRSSCPQQMKILWLLLKHGAQVNHRNKLGLTAFHIAAGNGNSEALQVLLLEDPDGIQYKTEIKETPLFFAVKNESMDCAELLLSWGANSEIFNLRRQRPIDLATSQDMRFILMNPTTVRKINHALLNHHKYTAFAQGDEAISSTCESLLTMTDEDTAATERNIHSSTKMICKYFDSPRGCVRGSKCFYAHGEEEYRKMKHGANQYHYHVAKEVRKIFVGGLSPSVDSDLLGNFFEEKFGPVEDAVVILAQTENKVQSRGFGFVTFKEEKSSSAAVQAHYITMIGKQVEIKSVVPRSFSATEQDKMSPRQEEEEKSCQPQLPAQTSSNETTMEANKSEQGSWVDKVLHGQPKACSIEPQAHVPKTLKDQSSPKWLKVFKKWFPGLLKDLSKLPKNEEYALSSLKGDFRAKFGLELDHASLGFPKLSDFIKSLSNLCTIKFVPTGKRGAPNHMILLPSSPRPHHQLHTLRMPHIPPVSSATDDSGDSKCPKKLSAGSRENVGITGTTNKDHMVLLPSSPRPHHQLHTLRMPHIPPVSSATDDSGDSKCLKELLAGSRENVGIIGTRNEDHMVLLPNSPSPQHQLLHTLRTPHTSPLSSVTDDSGDSKCLQDLSAGSCEKIGFTGSSNEEEKPSRRYPEVNSEKDVSQCVHPRFLQFLKPDPLFHGQTWVQNNKESINPRDPQRHLVLEDLARKRNKPSGYFLHEFDFYKDYKNSILEGKCFACKQRKMIWANFPCQHTLWCSECKLQAMRAAGVFLHKCVVCDAEVQRIILLAN